MQLNVQQKLHWDAKTVDAVNIFTTAFKGAKSFYKWLWLFIFVITSFTTAITIMAVEYTPVIFKGNVFLFWISCSIVYLFFATYFYFKCKYRQGHSLARGLRTMAGNSKITKSVERYFEHRIDLCINTSAIYREFYKLYQEQNRIIEAEIESTILKYRKINQKMNNSK